MFLPFSYPTPITKGIKNKYFCNCFFRNDSLLSTNRIFKIPIHGIECVPPFYRGEEAKSFREPTASWRAS